MTETQKDYLFMTILFIAFICMFVGIPTDDGMYLGYFWKFTLFCAEVAS